MMDAPKTIKEALALRYCKWGGNPKGVAYTPARCASEVWPYTGLPYQCLRRPGHGPSCLYCKQHAAKFEKQRRG